MSALSVLLHSPGILRANTLNSRERHLDHPADNLLAPILAYLLVMGPVIIAEGGLGFLGLSVPSPTPSWGGMIAEGREVLDQAL